MRAALAIWGDSGAAHHHMLAGISGSSSSTSIRCFTCPESWPGMISVRAGAEEFIAFTTSDLHPSGGGLSFAW